MLVLKVKNDGKGTEEVASYDYEVAVNDEVIESGRVEGHERKEGWRGLLRRIVKLKDVDDCRP